MSDRQTAYYLVADIDAPPAELPPPVAKATLTDSWRRPDTVEQLMDELIQTGRTREAQAIKRVLGHDDAEEAMRAYVSRQWADSWDSPEDALYDAL